MVRSFIAIDLSESVKDRLRGVYERLRHQVPDGSIRWARTTGIHLTLKFLGNVAEADMAQIEGTLQFVAQRHTPFAFTVGGVGCFPNVRKPRVIWIGIQEESGRLSALQGDVEQSLASLGFEAEHRAFHPHLTLGRTQRNVRPADQRRVGEIVALAGAGELAQMQVKSFLLMRSDLRPTGAVYTPLAHFMLNPEYEKR